MIQQGLFFFTIGSPETKVDWVYVDNLCYAYLKAYEKLQIEEKGQVEKKRTVRGQCYFISDQNPINNFLFMRPLMEGSDGKLSLL